MQNHSYEFPSEIHIKRRTGIYRGDRKFPDITNKIVIIVDDGLASGFTMIAAIKSLKRYNPAKIVVAVPVSSASAIREVEQYADEIVCLISRETYSFAVAGFYEEFPDLTDKEVIGYLEKSRKFPIGKFLSDTFGVGAMIFQRKIILLFCN